MSNPDHAHASFKTPLPGEQTLSLITAARRKAVGTAPIAEADAAPPRAAEVDSRTRALLRGAIVPTLLRLAWPNILVMLGKGIRKN